MANSKSKIEMYKMNLEHFLTPDSKEAIRWRLLEDVKRTQKVTWRGSHWPKIGQFGLQ